MLSSYFVAILVTISQQSVVQMQQHYLSSKSKSFGLESGYFDIFLNTPPTPPSLLFFTVFLKENNKMSKYCSMIHKSGICFCFQDFMDKLNFCRIYIDEI